MADLPQKVTLNDPELRARTRLQTQSRPITYSQRTAAPFPKTFNDVSPGMQSVTAAPAVAPAPATVATEPIKKAAVFHAPEPYIPIIQPKPQTAGFVQVAQNIQSVPEKSPKSPLISRHRVSMALTVLALLAFGGGIFVGINSLKTNRFVSAQITNLQKAKDPDAPQESPPAPNDLSSYQVPAAEPRFLSIEKLTIKTRVRKLGVKDNNELAAPANIFDAGWYEGSSKPDEAGAMLIDGHVQGPTKPGIFKNLDKLAVNDQLVIERGDGKKLHYHVVKTQNFDSTTMDMGVTLNSVVPQKNGLNIITCSGQYDTKTKNYSKRLVVFAVQD